MLDTNLPLMWGLKPGPFTLIWDLYERPIQLQSFLMGRAKPHLYSYGKSASPSAQSSLPSFLARVSPGVLPQEPSAWDSLS